jgi:mono/diheme cytochrome c family protein
MWLVDGVHRKAAALVVLVLAFGAPGLRAAPDAADARSKGEYLARLGDCQGCHTAPGGKPFAGGSVLPTPFGTISVPNITPDRATGIGSWTDEQFYRAMHEGIGQHGEYLYPVFPFPWYTKVTRADVNAIHSYLKTLPPVNAPRRPYKLAFPADNRESLLAWRSLFFNAGEFQPNPQASAQVNRGAYLVEGLGHCGECHNQHNVAGASRWSGVLEGGAIEGWYAPNLTADGNEGIGSWSVQDLAQYLHGGTAPRGGSAVGPMQEVINDSLSHLHPDDLQAMAAFLKSVPSQQSFPAVVASNYRQSAAPGSRTYLSYCGSCHGTRGEGSGQRVPALAHNGLVLAQGPEDIVRVMLGGVSARNGLSPMPAVGASMSNDQVAEVANYVRNAFGNAAPPTATSGLVANLRTQTHTTLSGQPSSGCPGPIPSDLSKAFESADTQRRLDSLTESNILQVIDAMVPKLQREAPHAKVDDLVNALTDSYCGVLKHRSLSAPARSELIGNFAVLSYGQLKSAGRG